MSQHTIERLCIGALLVFAAFVGYLVFYPRTRVVAKTVAPNGIELCVVQSGIWWGPERYQTSVYYHKPSSPWGWFYYDHQDDYWSTARIETDPAHSLITIFRGSHPALTFDYRTETYSLLRWNRTITGAQEWKPPTWKLSDL